MGCGSEIRQNTEISQILHIADLHLPTTDLELEDKYKEVLSGFVRPAWLMYGGSFTEVRSFYATLRRTESVELHIVSGRYGLVSGERLIVPYLKPVTDVADVEALESRHRVADSMLRVVKTSDMLMLFLPSHHIQFLIQNGWFERMKVIGEVIVVSASKFRQSLSRYPQMVILNRIGVARIGRKNQEAIINLLHRRQSP